MKIYRCSVIKHKCSFDDCVLNYCSGKQGTIIVDSHDKLIHADPHELFILSINNENEDIKIDKKYLEHFQCESE